jgi:hypothetical protein
MGAMEGREMKQGSADVATLTLRRANAGRRTNAGARVGPADADPLGRRSSPDGRGGARAEVRLAGPALSTWTGAFVQLVVSDRAGT